MVWTRRAWVALAVLVGIAALLLVTRGPAEEQGRAGVSRASGSREPEPLRTTHMDDDDDDDETATLAGIVVDATDQPIAAAYVCTAAKPRRCTSTATDGRFTLQGLEPGRHTVHATAAGYAPRQFPDPWIGDGLELAAGERVSDVRLVLARGGAAVSGSVEDMTGGFVEGALVSTSISGPATRSGDDGSFTLWLAPGRHRVTASAPGYGPASTSAIAPTDDAVIRLLPASAIEGIVVDRDGEPQAGATVRARDPLALFGPRQGAVESATTSSAPDGTFALRPLRPGLYEVSASVARAYGAAPEAITLGFAHSVTGVVVTVAPAPTLHGRVLVAGSDEPCPRGDVTLDNDAGKFSWTGPIAADGSVEILVPAPGTYTVDVNCSGHVAPPGLEPIEIGKTTPSPRTWHVRGGDTLGVTVVDGRATPIAGARVEVSSPIAGRHVRRSFTDGDGSATVRGLHAGQHAVTASAPGYAPVVEPVLVDVPAAELRIELDRGGRIIGQVLDEADKPVPDARVLVRVAARRGLNLHTRTDATGRFELRDVPGGTRTVAVVDAGWVPARSGQAGTELATERVHVIDGETAEVTLRIESLDRTIEGVVVDDTGAPVTDALVVARRDLGNTGLALRAVHRLRTGNLATITDLDGRFALTNLAEGVYSVRAIRRASGGQAVRSGVATGSTLTLQISALASIEGHVARRDGQPPPMFWTQLERRGMKWRRAQLFGDGSGAYRLTGVAPGRYSLGVKAGAGDGTRVVDVGQGQALTGIDFVLQDYATITGRAVDFDTGRPLPGYRFVAQDAQGGTMSPMFKNVSGPDGRFVIAAAPAGRVTVHGVVSDPRAPEHRRDGHRTFDIEPGETNDIGDFALARDRIDTDEPPGTLGFRLAFWDHEADQLEQHIDVTVVQPGGPADQAGLRVGDRVITVGPVDVTGNATYLFYSLTKVPVGTSVALGLARGRSVTVVAQ